MGCGVSKESHIESQIQQTTIPISAESLAKVVLPSIPSMSVGAIEKTSISFEIPLDARPPLPSISLSKEDIQEKLKQSEARWKALLINAGLGQANRSY
jgi:hypothetical protein